MASYDCSDCAHMGTDANKDGKFRCTNSRSAYYNQYVCAYMGACASFLESFNSRRGPGERKMYRDISRRR